MQIFILKKIVNKYIGTYMRLLVKVQSSLTHVYKIISERQVYCCRMPKAERVMQIITVKINRELLTFQSFPDAKGRKIRNGSVVR